MNELTRRKRNAPVVGTAINCALIVAMASLLISVGFWTAGVSQLGNWRGLFPAITLVAGLFAFVSTLVCRQRLENGRVVRFLALAVPCCLQPLAIAIGL